jgi:hypothetical protein
MATRKAFNVNQKLMAKNFGSISGDLIGNAQSLPRDVWESWDRDTVAIQRDALVLYDRLSSKIGKSVPIGKLVHYFGKSSSNPEVVTSMDGLAKARREQATVAYEGAPLPIHGSMFGFGWRQMKAAETDGWDMLDSVPRDDANRAVAEKIQTSLLDGDASVVFGGAVQYGLRNAPGRNTRSTGVTLNGATGVQWVAEILATLKLNHDDNFKVPMVVYVNWDDWFYASNTDYSTTKGEKSIAQKVREIEGVSEVVPIPDLAADEIFALIEDRRVIEIMNAMPITTTPMFRSNMTDNYDFEVIAATTTLFKRDADGKMALAHST